VDGKRTSCQNALEISTSDVFGEFAAIQKATGLLRFAAVLPFFGAACLKEA
jgi:hypothetical protein